MEAQPLEGVRVLELGTGISAAFATRWLAGFGADVVRPGGPGDLQPDEQVYLLAGKRRVDVPESALRHLALAADIVVEDQPPGALAALGCAPADLRAGNPALVVVSITPFGQSGPYSGYAATNITSFAMGGIMSLNGAPSRPPLVTGGSQALYLGGLNGFAAAVTTYFGALIHGEGDWVDISLQECAAGMLELYGPGADYMKTGPRLRSGNHVSAVWGIYPTADGYGGVCTLARQIPALFRVVGDPELQDERFTDPLKRLENDDELQARLFAWFATKTKPELLELGRQHKVPFGAVLTPAELLENDSLRDRSFFDSLPTASGEARVPGRPFLGIPWRPGVLHDPGADTAAVLADWLGGAA